MLLAGAAIYLIDQQLNLTGTVLAVLQTLFNGITFLAAAWAAALLGRMAANWMASLPRIRREPLNAELVRRGAAWV